MAEPVGTVWLTVAHAAAFLDCSVAALRKKLERRAVRAPDGGVEANIDGVRGRKFGKTWLVRFGARWRVEDER